MRRVPRAANEKATFAGMNITAIGRQEPQFPIVDTMELLESEQAIGVPKHKKNK